MADVDAILGRLDFLRGEVEAGRVVGIVVIAMQSDGQVTNSWAGGTEIEQAKMVEGLGLR